jgi:hypothetical protein
MALRIWLIALASSILPSLTGRRMHPKPKMESSSPFFGIFLYSMILFLKLENEILP